jgi:hypothetical protein
MAKRRPARRRTTRRRVMRSRKAPARRRAPARRNARRAPVRRRSTRRGMVRKTARRAYAKRNPRVLKLVQSEAFGIGVSAVVGGVVAAQLESMAAAPDSQIGKILSVAGTRQDGSPLIPVGVAGSVVTLLLATQSRNARTRKYLIGAAAGMVTPAIIGAIVDNPRGSQLGGMTYQRLARPMTSRTVMRSAPSSMVNTAQRFKLSTIPA